MSEIAHSALELYQRAYRLHYEERKINEAVEIYGRLIEAFPDSNVAAYASVQLQKINANKTSRQLRAGRNHLSVVALVLAAVSLALAVAAVTYASVVAGRMQMQNAYHSALSLAVGSMSAGMDSQALSMLSPLKSAARDDITPYALAAAIHEKHSEYQKAIAEYEAYQRLTPTDPLAATLLAVLKADRDDYLKSQAAPPPAETAPAVDSTASGAVRPPATGVVPLPAVKTAEMPAPVKRKSKLIIPPDSISFF
jgi:tetratricopeptide (TPR) repeat protein